MKTNKWLLYFLYGLLLLAYIIFGYKMLEYLHAQSIRTYEVLTYMIGSIIIYSVGGILLGLEKFILEVKKNGSWKVNWPKALFLGIPSFFLALGLFLLYPSPQFLSDTYLLPIFQMAFGYILITSFIKIEK